MKCYSVLARKEFTSDEINSKQYLYIAADNKLKGLASGAALNAFRAYFKLKDPYTYSVYPSAGASALDFVLNFDEEEESETTAIQNLTPDTPATSDKHIYTLSGQRVEQMTKGIYIVDGRKVIIK